MGGCPKIKKKKIKLLEEILSFRMQGVECDNGDMYVEGHKAASDVRDEFVSVPEKLMDELAQCYNVLPQLDINISIDHRPEFFFSSRRRHTRYWRDWSSDVCSSDLVAAPGHVAPLLMEAKAKPSSFLPRTSLSDVPWSSNSCSRKKWRPWAGSQEASRTT